MKRTTIASLFTAAVLATSVFADHAAVQIGLSRAVVAQTASAAVGECDDSISRSFNFFSMVQANPSVMNALFNSPPTGMKRSYDVNRIVDSEGRPVYKVKVRNFDPNTGFTGTSATSVTVNPDGTLTLGPSFGS